MTRQIRLQWPAVAAVFAVLAVVAAPLGAHHSVSGQFDYNRQVRLTGTITDIDWINPHIYIHVDVAGENGDVTRWRVSTLPVAMMRRAGITRAMLMGDGRPVELDVILARDGTRNLAWLLTIHYADGHHYQMSGS
jgi:hypothetical protein